MASTEHVVDDTDALRADTNGSADVEIAARRLADAVVSGTARVGASAPLPVAAPTPLPAYLESVTGVVVPPVEAVRAAREKVFAGDESRPTFVDWPADDVPQLFRSLLAEIRKHLSRDDLEALLPGTEIQPLVVAPVGTTRGTVVDTFARKMHALVCNYARVRERNTTITGFRGSGKTQLLLNLTVAASLVAPDSTTVAYVPNPVDAVAADGTYLTPFEMMATAVHRRGGFASSDGTIRVPKWASVGTTAGGDLRTWFRQQSQSILLVLDEAQFLYDSPLTARMVSQLNFLGQCAERTLMFATGSSTLLNHLFFASGDVNMLLRRCRFADQRMDLNDRKWNRGPSVRGFETPEEVIDFATLTESASPILLAKPSAAKGVDPTEGVEALAKQILRDSDGVPSNMFVVDNPEPRSLGDVFRETFARGGGLDVKHLHHFLDKGSKLLSRSVSLRTVTERFTPERRGMFLDKVLEWSDSGFVRYDGYDAIEIDTPSVHAAMQALVDDLEGLHPDEKSAILHTTGALARGPFENLVLDCLASKEGLRIILERAGVALETPPEPRCVRPRGGWPLGGSRPLAKVSIPQRSVPSEFMGGDFCKEHPDRFGADGILCVGHTTTPASDFPVRRPVVVRVQVKGSEENKVETLATTQVNVRVSAKFVESPTKPLADMRSWLDRHVPGALVIHVYATAHRVDDKPSVARTLCPPGGRGVVLDIVDLRPLLPPVWTEFARSYGLTIYAHEFWTEERAEKKSEFAHF